TSGRRHTRFSRDWSSDVCSSDLEDALLRGRIGDVAVYYDRNGFEGGSARLDIRRIPIRQHGCFHPKNVLLLLEDEDSGTRRVVEIGRAACRETVSIVIGVGQPSQ